MAKKRTSETDWARQYAAERAKAKAAAAADLTKARQVLTRLKVENVFVDYDGAGDSGAIEQIRFYPVPKAGIPHGIEGIIEKAAYELLPDGWEINEGSYGILDIDVRTGKVQREHSWRFTEVNTEETQLEL